MVFNRRPLPISKGRAGLISTSLMRRIAGQGIELDGHVDLAGIEARHGASPGNHPAQSRPCKMPPHTS